ncbi:class I SAM-dependent methyltransferase [Candidatus Saccharibacteria bacterium]|nr:class I SAM-dependent methyltransferase [Candidatus Saccharibacteria bacterium]
MAWKNDQVSKNETEFIAKIARECLDVQGDFVELGCYKGDTSLALAELLKNSNSDKKLWLYDSFEGLPEKAVEDNSPLGEDFKEGELLVTKRDVKERFLRSGLRVPIIKKGWFADFSDSDLPEKAAFCFLDGDFYRSIRDGLKLVENKMNKGAVLIVHDYNNPALPGVKKAVDEWVGTRGLQVLETCAIIRCK